MAAVSMLEQDDRQVEYLDWDDPDDYVAVRPRGYRVLRAVLALVILLVIGFLLYRGVRGWFNSQLDPEGEPGAAVTVVIEPGSSTSNIADTLEEHGVIPNSTFFRYYADWNGDGNFQAGEYEMQENSSVEEAIEVLNAGPIPPVFTTFGVPEGLWLDEMLPRIAEQVPGVSIEQLRAVLASNELQPRYRPAGETSWEGLLFPATYEVEDDATAAQVLAKMNDEFARVTGELGYGAADTRLGLNYDITAYEAIIVASMVEAEARTDGDRPKIARVIYNRLEEGMSLDIDATCIYGTGDRSIPPGDALNLMDATPWDCRTNPELPPTPISFPGEASLEAAINPAEGNWLFYVLMDEQGNHFFTDDIDAFNEQVDIAREQGLFE